eukprot:gene23922-biopygen19373
MLFFPREVGARWPGLSSRARGRVFRSGMAAPSFRNLLPGSLKKLIFLTPGRARHAWKGRQIKGQARSHSPPARQKSHKDPLFFMLLLLILAIRNPRARGRVFRSGTAVPSVRNLLAGSLKRQDFWPLAPLEGAKKQGDLGLPAHSYDWQVGTGMHLRNVQMISFHPMGNKTRLFETHCTTRNVKSLGQHLQETSEGATTADMLGACHTTKARLTHVLDARGEDSPCGTRDLHFESPNRSHTGISSMAIFTRQGRVKLIFLFAASDMCCYWAICAPAANFRADSHADKRHRSMRYYDDLNHPITAAIAGVG